MANQLMRSLLLACCACAVAACTRSGHSSGPAPEPLLSKIRSRGALVVATEAALEPFEFVRNGQIVGYNKEILDCVAAGLGVRLEQINLPFQGILPGLIARKFDFVATSVTINAERARKYAFTRPIGSADNTVLVRANDMRVKTPDDLRGLTVATQLASAEQPVVEAHDAQLQRRGMGGYATIKLFAAFPETQLALASGQVDAIAIASPAAAVLMKKVPGTYRIATVIGKAAPLAWVTRPEDLDLRDYINAKIDELRDSGKLREWQLKWFGFVMETPQENYLPTGAQ